MVVKRRTSNKNPPILSHDFVIQNHADIVSINIEAIKPPKPNINKNNNEVHKYEVLKVIFFSGGMRGDGICGWSDVSSYITIGLTVYCTPP